MDMSYEKVACVHKHPPCEGAVASPEGWRLSATGELLVSVLGLDCGKHLRHASHETNDKPEPPPPGPDVDTGSQTADNTTQPPSPEQSTQNEQQTVQEGSQDDSGGVYQNTSVFDVSFKGAKAFIVLKAPNNHKWTKWEVNGVAQDKRGNEMTAYKGQTVVASNAKGVFTETI